MRSRHEWEAVTISRLMDGKGEIVLGTGDLEKATIGGGAGIPDKY